MGALRPGSWHDSVGASAVADERPQVSPGVLRTYEERVKTVTRWALVGLGIGFFWLAVGFLFFTAPESLVVNIAKFVAVATCPPFTFVDFLMAPIVNAVLYGALALGVRMVLAWRGGGGRTATEREAVEAYGRPRVRLRNHGDRQ